MRERIAFRAPIDSKLLPTGENYPAVVGGKHADFPTASERIAIEQRPETGRFAVAASRINVGDVLVVEKPFASVMNPKKYATHCHHCFRV
jgi:hypothetical protein